MLIGLNKHPANHFHLFMMFIVSAVNQVCVAIPIVPQLDICLKFMNLWHFGGLIFYRVQSFYPLNRLEFWTICPVVTI